MDGFIFGSNFSIGETKSCAENVAHYKWEILPIPRTLTHVYFGLSNFAHPPPR